GDKAAPLAEVASALAAVFAVILPPVPSLPRYFHNAILPRPQVPPVLLHVPRFRIPPTQPDDRDLSFCLLLCLFLARRNFRSARTSWAPAHGQPRFNGS